MGLPRSLLLAALLGAPIALVAAPEHARADDASDNLVFEVQGALQRGGMFLERQHFDADQCENTAAKAEDALKRLVAMNPGEPRIPDLKKAIADYRSQAAQLALGAITQPVDNEKQFFKRSVEAFEQADRNPSSSNLTAASTNLKRIEKILEDNKAVLASSDAGKAYEAEVRKYIADSKDLLKTDGVLADLRSIVFEEDRNLNYSLDRALKNVPDALDNQRSEDAAKAWTAAKKLEKPLEAARFKDLQLTKDTLARFAEVGARYDKEMGALVAAQKVGPLISSAKSTIEQLNKAVDGKNESSVRDDRKLLATETLELRTTLKDNADAKQCVADADAALLRCDSEFTDQFATTELSELEVRTTAVLDSTARAIDKKDATKAQSGARKLRLTEDLLSAYGSHPKAKTIAGRIEGMLARVDAAFKGVAAGPGDDEVPHFEVDFNADADVQRTIAELNGQYAFYRERQKECEKRVDEDLRLAEGMDGSATSSIFHDIDSTTASMIDIARRCEKTAGELAKLDAKNAAIATIKDWTPRLVKRAQTIKAVVGKQCDYANAIHACATCFEMCGIDRDRAMKDGPEAARKGWPTVISHMTDAKKALAPAFTLLPDEHSEADIWAARADAWRKEAESALTEVCVTQAQKLALAGQKQEAQAYADALKEALPKAPENDSLAKALSGAGAARLKCQAEIKEREELLKTRAAEAATAFAQKYGDWKSAQKPQSLAAHKILQDLGAAKGKKVAGHYSLIDGIYDFDNYEIDGEIWHIVYDPDVRAKLVAQRKKLDDMSQAIAAGCAKKYGISEAGIGFSHMFLDCDFVVEITGSHSYTPKHEVRDNGGGLIGSVEGTPYPVPAGAIRGIRSKYYVIVPGVGSSLDAMKTDGIVPK